MFMNFTEIYQQDYLTTSNQLETNLRKLKLKFWETIYWEERPTISIAQL